MGDLWHGRVRILGECPRHGRIEGLPRAELKRLIEAVGIDCRLEDARTKVMCTGCHRYGDVRFVDLRPDAGRVPTLGEAVRDGYPIEVICTVPSCGDSAYLDLNALTKRFGPGLGFDRLRAMLRCKGCGSKGKARTIIRLPNPADTAARAVAMMELIERRRIERPPTKKHREARNE